MLLLLKQCSLKLLTEHVKSRFFSVRRKCKISAKIFKNCWENGLKGVNLIERGVHFLSNTLYQLPVYNNVKNRYKSETNISKVCGQMVKIAGVTVWIWKFIINEFFWEFSVKFHVMRIKISIDPVFRKHAPHQSVDTGSKLVWFQQK